MDGWTEKYSALKKS